MKYLVILLCGIEVALNSVVPAKSQSMSGQQNQRGANPNSLRGGSPFYWNVLPKLPPDGFYAVCYTSAGSCIVQASAPIAPSSVCYCASYSGQTK